MRNRRIQRAMKKADREAEKRKEKGMDIYTATEEAYKRGYEQGKKEGCGKCGECKFYDRPIGTSRWMCVNPCSPVMDTAVDFGCICFEKKEKKDAGT